MPDEILLKIQADVKDLKAKIKKIESEFSGSSKKIQSNADAMSNKFKAMGNVLKIALSAAVLYKFKQGLQACIKATSDLEEQTAKFKIVFKGSLDVANKYVTELRNNYGMSTREARQYMASLQDLLVPMGMARDKAAELSGQIVKNAADFGSFNNTLTIEQIEKFKAALVGMYKPMRDNGVVLMDTAVRQRAVKEGMAAITEEVTPLQKAMVAYRMILEQTKDAQGDMERTAGSYANTMKRANASIEELKVAIGTIFLPTAAKAIEKLSGFITEVTLLTNSVRKFFTTVEDGEKSIKGELNVLEKVNQSIEKETELLKTLKALKEKEYIDSSQYTSELTAGYENLDAAIEGHTKQLAKYQEMIQPQKVKQKIADIKAEISKLGMEMEGKSGVALWNYRIKITDLSKKLKNLEDIYIRLNPIVETALRTENKILGEILSKRQKEQEYNEKRYEFMLDIIEKQEEELQKESEGLIEQLEESRTEEEEKAQRALEGMIKSQERLNQSWKDGIQYVIDLGDVIDVMFSQAANKGQQLQNMLWSLFGGAIGYMIGGPGGAGIGSRIGAGIGRATTSSVGDRRSAELSNRMVNSKTYTAYQIGV